ncbi:DUF1844 domain-containing protein [bacterium]|jgi:hypothetical protein|nr:DUF1844 domain-containing protein [bacterium]
MKEGLFTFVITFFSGWGWQSLGKVANPASGEIERNLDLAKHTIDILEMLREKTEGNITEEEKTFLNGVIAELQINYVDEVKKADKKDDVKDNESSSKEETKES